MNNLVFRPDELYGRTIGDKPDLTVYFDDLNWRSAGAVGHDSLYLFENETCPDDSVHSMMGIFLIYDPKRKSESKTLENAKIADIAPTLLKMFDLPIADGLDWRVLEEVVG